MYQEISEIINNDGNLGIKGLSLKGVVPVNGVLWGANNVRPLAGLLEGKWTSGEGHACKVEGEVVHPSCVFIVNPLHRKWIDENYAKFIRSNGHDVEHVYAIVDYHKSWLLGHFKSTYDVHIFKTEEAAKSELPNLNPRSIDPHWKGIAKWIKTRVYHNQVGRVIFH